MLSGAYEGPNLDIDISTDILTFYFKVFAFSVVHLPSKLKLELRS